MPRARNTNTRRRPRNRSARNPVKNLRRQLHGASLRIPADPPSTVDRPWNSAVLVMPLTTLGNVTVELVTSAFQTQIAAVTTPGVLFRFLQVRAWELSGADISLSLLDLGSGGDTLAIRTQHDQPGRNHWARVGEMWPTTQQNDVVASTNSTRNLFVLQSGATSANVRVHLHILWRYSGTASPQIGNAKLREHSCETPEGAHPEIHLTDHSTDTSDNEDSS